MRLRMKTFPNSRDGWATYYARRYEATKLPEAERLMWIYMLLAEAERQGDL